MSIETIRVSPEIYDYTAAYQRHGNGIYLAEGETFESVVSHDSAILAEAGVTQQQVGQSLRQLFDTFNTFLPSRGPIVNEPIPGIILTRQVFELGQEWSPYLRGVSSNIDWRVHTNNMSNGNKAFHPISGPTHVSDMLPEMIEELGFFEGNVFYGIEPNWAIAIHRLVEKHQPEPYVPIYTKEAWDQISSWMRFKDRVINDIVENAISTELFLPGVTATIAPGDIAPHGWDQYTGEPQFTYKYNPGTDCKVQLWALLYAAQDTLIPPDAKLAGYPLGKYCREVKKGTNIARYFPHNDQHIA